MSTFFFRSTELIFRALPKHVLVPVLVNISQANFKKTAKKDVFRHFLENFDQKIAFFRRALPPQVYIGAKGAFRQILWSVGQKRIS